MPISNIINENARVYGVFSLQGSKGSLAEVNGRRDEHHLQKSEQPQRQQKKRTLVCSSTNIAEISSLFRDGGGFTGHVPLERRSIKEVRPTPERPTINTRRCGGVISVVGD